MSITKENTLSLAKKSQEIKLAIFCQFGGQGAPWIKELNNYYTRAEDNASFYSFPELFATLFRTLKKELPTLKNISPKSYEHGFDLENWLQNAPDTAKNLPGYLSNAAISLPMIAALHFAHWTNLRNHWSTIDKSIIGMTGHSQGLFAATFASLYSSSENYTKALEDFFTYMLYLGASAERHYDNLKTQDNIQEIEGTSPMLAVLGATQDVVSSYVQDLNEKLSIKEQIYISLYNTPTNFILSSIPSSLAKFQETYQQDAYKFIYLNTSCPFHSAHMSGISEIFENALENHFSFDYTPNDLKTPVHSFYNKDNLQNINDSLAKRLYKDMMIHPLHWSSALEPVFDTLMLPSIIDLGPAKTSMRLSNESLAAIASSKKIDVLPEIFAFAVNKDQAKIITV